VLLRELFLKENQAGPHPTTGIALGRAFNHPEHFIIFYGLSGIKEGIQHLEDAVGEDKQLRFKWDGNPQIYWGRERKNGPLILAGHNGWAKGGRGNGTTMDDFTSPEAVENFILHKSGEGAKGEEITPERQRFASEFSNLYHIFDAATPKDFVGFVYADALFLPSTKPTAQNGIYTMHPNPHSKSEYHVDANGTGPLNLSKRIPQAQAMVVAHGTFKTFGAPDNEQIPVDDFSKFDKSPGLIVVSPIYNNEKPDVDMSSINQVKEVGGYIDQHGENIQNFVTHIPTGDRQGFFYKFLNQRNSANDFDTITPQMFYNWMAQPNKDGKPQVSLNKQQHIKNTDLKFNALAPMFHLMKIMRHSRHAINDSVNSKHKPECWATNPEGFVRYANPKKFQHGHVKFQNAGWKD